jgi:ABC-type uncharacterized transport system auxiliary subunit
MKKYIVITILVLITFLGCSRGELIPTNYYVLDYFAHLDKPELVREKPFNYSVWVPETKIPQNYARKQIVVRHFGPKITYDQFNLWGVKLSSIIPELLVKKINNYHFFKQARTELYREKADFVIESSISNIEFSISGNMNQARIVMEFVFKRIDEEKIIFRHLVNREDKLSDDSFDNFVLRINTILFEEMDAFLATAKDYLESGAISQPLASSEELRKEAPKVYDESSPTGMGTLFVPALSGTDNEPYFKVFDANDKLVESERMGTPVVLPTGKYRVQYGTGTPMQMMTQENVTIHARYRTTLATDWGCLMVDMLDEDRNFAKVRYQVYDAETGDSYGDVVPKDEELGEKRTVWVLPPGLYKIIINNEAFNTIRNYTTVLIEQGEMHTLRLVVGLDDDNNPTNLIGAGILSGIEVFGMSKHWKFHSAIHGNMNVISKNESDKDEQETSITLTSQIESQLIYDKKPFHFVTKNIIDLGTSKTSDTDFRLSLDSFDLKNTLIYYFLEDIGLYLRGNLNTHLFPTYFNFAEPSNYTLVDTNGDTLSVHTNQKKVQIRPSFYPLNLKEGAGLNVRLLNRAKISTSLRFGFGMEQNILSDVFVKDSEGTNIYREQKSDYKEGMEISLIGTVQVLPNITYSTDAYVLFPFKKSKNRTFEWENTLNFKLFRYVSLDYKLRLENRYMNDEEYLFNEHSLFLRVTYLLN